MANTTRPDTAWANTGTARPPLGPGELDITAAYLTRNPDALVAGKKIGLRVRYISNSTGAASSEQRITLIVEP